MKHSSFSKMVFKAFSIAVFSLQGLSAAYAVDLSSLGEQYTDVLKIRSSDRSILILTDTASETEALRAPADDANWQFRLEYSRQLAEQLAKLHPNIKVYLGWYKVTSDHGAPLPDYVFVKNVSSASEEVVRSEIDSLLYEQDVVISMPTFSATGPLIHRVEGDDPRFRFRSVSIPELDERLLLAMDFDVNAALDSMNNLANHFHDMRDLEMKFEVKNDDGSVSEYQMTFDMRGGHEAHGEEAPFLPRVLSNFPYGEVWNVPNETSTSRTRGVLPYMDEGELVIARVEHNKIVEVLSDGVRSRILKEDIKLDPARGNIAELGFGILGALGVKPTGLMLSDEKLGLHIARGASDHLGGVVGADNFRNSDPIHLDYVYLNDPESKIIVRSVVARYTSDRKDKLIMQDGQYVDGILNLTQASCSSVLGATNRRIPKTGN